MRQNPVLLLVCGILVAELWWATVMGVIVSPDKRPQLPPYEVMDRMPSSTINTDPEFVSLCKKFAGYYKDPQRDSAHNNTIMIVSFNFGYLKFFHNFKCFTDRLGIKFLPIVFDDRAKQYLQKKKVKLNNNSATIGVMLDQWMK